MKYKHSYSNQILLPNSSTIILYSQIILYGQKNYSYLNQNILLISASCLTMQIITKKSG